MPQAVDYVALAEQVRQSAQTPSPKPSSSPVDYAALAEQARQESSQTPDLRPSSIDLRTASAADIERYEAERTRPVRELLSGFAKQVARRGIQGGALLRKIPGVQAIAEALPSVEVPIGLETPLERAGANVEQAAEAMKGGGLVAGAFRKAPLLIRAVGEAAGLAGIAASQGQDPKTAAVIGAAIPLTGAAVRTVPASLRASAAAQVARALGATKERFKAIATRRAPEILRRGLRGTRRQLLADATLHAREAGQAVDEGLAIVGQHPAPIAPVLDALEEAKQAFLVTRRLSLREAARQGLLQQPGVRVVGKELEIQVVLDARAIAQLTKLQHTIRALGEEATVDQLVAVRRVWDRVVDQAGGFAHRRPGALGLPLREQTEVWAKREATNAIRKALADTVPDLAKVNAEYAFWTDLKQILQATTGRTQAQGPGLGRVVAAVGGSVGGYASGDSVEDRIQQAIVGGFIAPSLLRGLTSAPWRLVNAQLRNALADALASGVPQRITAAVARIVAVRGPRPGASRLESAASRADTPPR